MPPIVLILPGYIFCLIVGIINYKHLPKAYRLVFVLLLLAILCDGFGYYLAHYLHKQNNSWLFNIYMQLEFWFMGSAALYLVSRRSIKTIFWSLLILNTAIWMVQIITKTIFQFSNVAMVSCSISLVCIYIVVLLNNSLYNQRSIIRQPIFWLAASAILYFSCVVPYMALTSFLFRRFVSLAYKLHYIISVLNVCRYSLIAVSFILMGREGRVRSSGGTLGVAK